MPLLFAQKKSFYSDKPVWWAGVLLSLGVGTVLYVMAAKSVTHDASERFSQQARNGQYTIASSIQAYTGVLRASASFFNASDTVSRADFHHYVAGLDLDTHLPALETINYVRHFDDAQRGAVETELRRLPGIDASGDPDPAGYHAFAVKPAGRRAEYDVLSMIEPLRPYDDRLGIDIATRPHVADALAYARDSGKPGTSGQPVLALNSPQGATLALRLPLYRRNAPLESVAQRRAAYTGSVGIGISVHRLVQATLDQMPVRGVRLTLYDSGGQGRNGGGPDNDILLFDSLGGSAAPVRADGDHFVLTLPVDFSGRLWKATFSTPMATWYSRFDAYLPWLAMLAGFMSCMLFYLLFHTLSSSRLRAIRMANSMTKELRDSQAKLQLSHHKLRRLAAHADQIKEQERKRIAREIHDDLGQNLLVLRIEADMLANRTRQRHSRLHARARSTLAQIDATIRSVRHIINDLRPNVLDLGLGAAVEWQIAQFRQRSGMVCELIEHQEEIAIDDRCATAFFRVLQESLSNILQHARASVVRVELSYDGGVLTMVISDNGIGLRDSSRNKVGSFGLVGIEERISLLCGTCSITGSPNGGTTVTISAPIEYQPPPVMMDAINETARMAADVTS